MTQLSRGAGLKLLDLGKRFGNHAVLRELNLEVPSGQFVAIVGRSGCGKSTLLRLVSGLDHPTSGIIYQDGNPLRQLNRAARVMFQDARLLPWQRVWENVGLGVQQNWKERSLWALQQVGLASHARDWPSTLSGGQRQRVALARALVSQPRLFLLDEPLSALDALTRMDMQHLIERLWQEQGFTAILITHDVEEAVALADRVVMIDAGQIALDWEVSLSRPRQRQEAAFVTLVERILQRITGLESREPALDSYRLS